VSIDLGLPTLAPTRTNFFVRRFTLAEYHTLIEVGVLKPGDPYELLNGVIKYKMPQNTPHASTASKLEKRFWKLLPDEFLLRTQKPISIPNQDSEPEPDLAVVLGPDDRYDEVQPTPREVLLIVEVADTSLDEDRGEKLESYAAARIPIYWVVNLRERVVEVYTQPRGGRSPGYRGHDTFAPGQAVPVVVGKKAVGAIPVSEILP
jgi:hypothetical protein